MHGPYNIIKVKYCWSEILGLVASGADEVPKPRFT
jgi:hypothetical protein